MKKLLKNKKGFTIIELVIVIAVIAILAAVLIPTFASVIAKSHESNARSRAKAAYSEIIVTKTGGSALDFTNKKLQVLHNEDLYEFEIDDKGQLKTDPAFTDGGSLGTSALPSGYTEAFNDVQIVA